VQLDSVIEEDVKIGQNCVIGGYGFGYELDEAGQLQRMPHLGNVVIERGCTIHNLVNIDRAVLGSTRVGAYTRIDSLVHIAHNVTIGANCAIVSGVVIAGSCTIGENTFIGMNASIRNGIKIGANCFVGAGAVVVKDVPDRWVVMGNPAKRHIK
jgi:UDP-3-O-[3-hydroxymyristoyl] glucosamine N-acyltransferase